MKPKQKNKPKTTGADAKYNNTIFLNGKCCSIHRLNKKKRTKEFIKDII